MFFRDTFPIGRIPALIPATWSDGWPTFGNNGVVPVNGAFAKPIELSPEEELLRAAEEHRRLGRLRQRRAAPGLHGRAVDASRRRRTWTQSLIGVELLANPGFETGTAGVDRQRHGDDRSPTTDAASGAGALQVTGRTTTGSGPAQDVTGKVQHTVTYDISAKVKYDNPSSPATKQFFVTARYRQQHASRTSPA